jgi:hypothetical protein
MSEMTTIGLDLTKNVFQVHGVDATSAPVLRKRLRRGQARPRRHSCASCKPPHPPPTVADQANRRRPAIEIVVAQWHLSPFPHNSCPYRFDRRGDQRDIQNRKESALGAPLDWRRPGIGTAGGRVAFNSTMCTTPPTQICRRDPDIRTSSTRRQPPPSSRSTTFPNSPIRWRPWQLA